MLIINCILFLLVMCPGCLHKKIDTQKEFAKIDERTLNMLDEKVYAEDSFNFYGINSALKEKIESGLSSDDAVRLALIQNPHLKADFEQLGLAKADFEQAALFRNPHFDIAAKIPVNQVDCQSKFVTQFDMHLVFSIEDLWQIGARKRVAKDELEIVAMRINQTILDTYTSTKKAYYDCIAAQAQLDLTQKLLQTAFFWKDRIYYRKEFGLVSDLDTYLADAKLASYELDVIIHMKELQNAFIGLRFLLGINIASDDLPLTETFEYPESLPEEQDLLNDALKNHPAMQIARLKVQQAQDRLSYEKRRVVKEAEIGFAFERDFDRPIGPGVYLGLELPLFDTNAVQIAYAQTMINKTKKELLLQQAKVRKEFLEAYQELIATYQAIKNHAIIVINYEHAVAFAQEQVESMRFDKALVLQTQLSLYQAKKMQIEAYYDLAHAWIDLERTVGRKIESIDKKGIINELLT